MPTTGPAGHRAAPAARKRHRAGGPRRRRLDAPAGSAGLHPGEEEGARGGSRRDGHGHATTRPLPDAGPSASPADFGRPHGDRRLRQAPAAAGNLVMWSCQREFLRPVHPSTASPWDAAPWTPPNAASPSEIALPTPGATGRFRHPALPCPVNSDKSNTYSANVVRKIIGVSGGGSTAQTGRDSPARASPARVENRRRPAAAP